MNIFFKKSVFAAQLVLITLISFSSVQAAGEIDPTFNGSAFVQPRGFNYAVARQPADGKILVGGQFAVANGLRRNSLARFDSNGILDTSFNASAISGIAIRVIIVQPDGKILIAGSFRIGNSSNTAIIARLNADGSLDDSFEYITSFSTPYLRDAVLLPDGKIILAGEFEFTVNGVTRRHIARLNADGTIDTTFNAITTESIQNVEVQADGKVIGGLIRNGSNLFLKRYNQDGSEDTTFNAVFTGGGIIALKIQPDGKLLVGGTFSSVNNTTRANLVRLNTNGTLDEMFNPAQPPNSITEIELEANGKIIISKYDSAPSSQPKTIVRYETNGAVDGSFNFTTEPVLPIYIGYDVLPLPDGKILLAGYKANQSITGGTTVRVNQDGTIDQTFKAFTGQFGSISKIVPQPDGKVLVAGTFGALGGTERPNFGRFNFDGTPDTSFVPALVSSTPGANYLVSAIALQPNGKILVSGGFTGGLARLNSDGSLDTTFTSPGTSASDIIVLPDGKIIAVSNSAVRRYNSDGSADAAFTTVMPNDPITRAAVQPDGKILVVGDFTVINSSVRGRIARLNVDGTLDTSFNPPGGADGTIRELELQSDGKIVIVGYFRNINGVNRSFVARLNTDGTFDTTFNALVNSYTYNLKIQPDNKIIIGGEFTNVNGVARNRLARLNADGSTDTNFQIGTGPDALGYELALTSNGKILVGGAFSSFNGIEKLAIVRLLNDAAGRTRFDFDGDGRADVAVFRPSNGNWYRLSSQTNAFSAVTFGQSNDRLAPADYDGDGRTDIAVFREGAFGYFYILDSATNTFNYNQFGTSGDVPLPGDWDGDGRADLAVYREGTSGNFYYRPTSQPTISYNTISLGSSGDKPLVGDFDGDGRNDAAVFRPSTATWFILQSSNTQMIQTTFGLSTDIPVPADYDGDGRANIAVFRPSSGTWFTSTNAANNYGAIAFGANGDLPVPADYDGDGKADVAVYRPTSGAWYLQRSTQGFTGIAFGDGNDKPIPNAFIR